MHAMATTGIERWADRADVTAEQLRTALAEIRDDYKLSTSSALAMHT